jgi:hypothetical protein
LSAGWTCSADSGRGVEWSGVDDPADSIVDRLAADGRSTGASDVSVFSAVVRAPGSRVRSAAGLSGALTRAP